MFRRAWYVAVDWLPFYEVDWQAMKVKNQVAHLALDYQWARAKITKARKYLERVEDYTERKFLESQKATLDKTAKAISNMKLDVETEEAEIMAAHSEAMKKLESKKVVVGQLVHTISVLGTEQYPLK